MRMSLSRLAALGLAFMAGVTLASCASSSAPFPGTGPNPQHFSFQGNNIGVLQGSPNMNLGITVADFYIDNQLAAPFLTEGAGQPFFLSIPAATHDFKFLQAGTQNTLFLDTTFKTSAGTKYLIIAQGDAAVHSTDIGIYQIPHYSTSNGAVAFSFFNASPRAGTVDVWYDCFNCVAPVKMATGVTVGSHLSPTTSWKNNVLGVVSGGYCFSAYATGTTTPVLASNPAGSDAHAGTGACNTALGLNLTGGSDSDFGIIDSGAAPGILMGFFVDMNG